MESRLTALCVFCQVLLELGFEPEALEAFSMPGFSSRQPTEATFGKQPWCGGSQELLRRLLRHGR